MNGSVVGLLPFHHVVVRVVEPSGDTTDVIVTHVVELVLALRGPEPIYELPLHLPLRSFWRVHQLDFSDAIQTVEALVEPTEEVHVDYQFRRREVPVPHDVKPLGEDQRVLEKRFLRSFVEHYLLDAVVVPGRHPVRQQVVRELFGQVHECLFDVQTLQLDESGLHGRKGHVDLPDAVQVSDRPQFGQLVAVLDVYRRVVETGQTSVGVPEHVGLKQVGVPPVSGQLVLRQLARLYRDP